MPHPLPHIAMSPSEYPGFILIEIWAETPAQLFETVARIEGAFGGAPRVEEFRPCADDPTRSAIELKNPVVVH